MDLELTGRTAIVTGGSHGLGRATALAFADEGVRVAICGRQGAALEAAAREIATAARPGAEVLPVVADVTRGEDLEALVTTTRDRFGSVDIVVNNADSVSHDADFFALTDEDWLERFNVKLLAAVRLARLVAPGMIERRWGRILSISGGSSRRMREGGWTKGAAHAGLINLTKKLADLLGPHGITVNVVEPGDMWTDGPTREGRSRAELRRERLQRRADEAGVSYEVMAARELESLVIRRRIEPAEAAAIIVFLASDRAAAITGEVVLADGGQTRTVRY
jgi:3-oxoacyl-[acyl-carrier protein] reductase/bacilysin biosynthesis oxidoreductase BacG